MLSQYFDHKVTSQFGDSVPANRDGKRTATTFSSEVSTANMNRLVINVGHTYNLKLKAGSGTSVKVDFEGPKVLLDALTFSPDASDLTLKDSYAGPINFFGSADEVKGTISLPESLTLKLELSGAAQAMLTGHNGALSAHNTGATTVTLSDSRSENPTLDLSGASTVNLDNCQGEAILTVDGTSKINCNRGQIAKLTAKAVGASTILIKTGTLTALDVTASGASHIKVPKPNGQTKQDLSGLSSLSYN